MRVKLGGAVIDVRLATAKLWAGTMVILFIISTLYFMSYIDTPEEPSHKRRSTTKLNDTQSDDTRVKVLEGLLLKNTQLANIDPNNLAGKNIEAPNGNKAESVPKKKGDQYNDELINVHMAMDVAKDKYDQIIIKQKDILANQNRPDDSHFNINVTLSDKISMDRKVIDSRPEACHTFHYDIKTLPNASVIIPFYNEALSMLIRTIHSVLNHSPDELLNEVILVDDASTRDYLKTPLDEYVALLPKVRIMRNTERKGLIVSRLIGSRSSKGSVVVFLDAHTECNVGWLEPLVDYIQRHPASVLQPFVDGIDKDTIEYLAPPILYKGGFSWDMGYRWIKVLDQDAKASQELGVPFFSPTLVGCAMAVDKQYFEHIGEFDEGLKVWGGENIELAFRVWQCGGRVATVICSRVGHVFKNFPYKFDGDREQIVSKNLIRVSETWMDGFRKYYYATARVYDFKRTELDADELASLSGRIELRKRLRCKNFEWYMHNIIPELPIPPSDATYYGEIGNLRTHACWEPTDDYYIGMNYLCYEHKIIPENYFYIDTKGRLKFQDKCVHIAPPAPALRIKECTPENDPIIEHGLWSLKARGETWGQLTVRLQKPGETNYQEFCVTQVTNVYVKRHEHVQMPQLSLCKENDDFQLWVWTYRFDWNQVPKRLHSINNIGEDNHFIL